jgi:hypothetical protein
VFFEACKIGRDTFVESTSCTYLAAVHRVRPPPRSLKPHCAGNSTWRSRHWAAGGVRSPSTSFHQRSAFLPALPTPCK